VCIHYSLMPLYFKPLVCIHYSLMPLYFKPLVCIHYSLMPLYFKPLEYTLTSLKLILTFLLIQPVDLSCKLYMYTLQPTCTIHQNAMFFTGIRYVLLYVYISVFSAYYSETCLNWTSLGLTLMFSKLNLLGTDFKVL
jgi:hypothetical protein